MYSFLGVIQTPMELHVATKKKKKSSYCVQGLNPGLHVATKKKKKVPIAGIEPGSTAYEKKLVGLMSAAGMYRTRA